MYRRQLVHYLLIGGVMDGGPALLGRFLENWEAMSPVEAFRATFGMEPAEMNRVLYSYARESRLNVASTALAGSESEFAVEPASHPTAPKLTTSRPRFGSRQAIGQAALALASDDTAEARRLVELALSGSYQLSSTERVAADALLRRLDR